MEQQVSYRRCFLRNGKCSRALIILRVSRSKFSNSRTALRLPDSGWERCARSLTSSKTLLSFLGLSAFLSSFLATVACPANLDLFLVHRVVHSSSTAIFPRVPSTRLSSQLILLLLCLVYSPCNPESSCKYILASHHSPPEPSPYGQAIPSTLIH